MRIACILEFKSAARADCAAMLADHDHFLGTTTEFLAAPGTRPSLLVIDLKSLFNISPYQKRASISAMNLPDVPHVIIDEKPMLTSTYYPNIANSKLNILGIKATADTRGLKELVNDIIAVQHMVNWHGSGERLLDADLFAGLRPDR